MTCCRMFQEVRGKRFVFSCDCGGRCPDAWPYSTATSIRQEASMTAPHVEHTASYLLDLVDLSTEERFSIYRCDTCFALVMSEDATDHGRWHNVAGAR